MFHARVWFAAAMALMMPWVAEAHEIHLKNGAVIESGFIQRHQSRLTYRQFGGEVSIPLTDVEKIIYTKTQPTPRTVHENEATLKQTSGDNSRDLKGVLETRLNPQGPIETANISVVSIQTASGSGTGFFINGEGLIVTNRHVVKGSRVNERSMELALTKAEQRLREWRSRLKQEKGQLDLYQKNLREEWSRFKRIIEKQGNPLDMDRRRSAEDRLKQRSGYLKQWQRDYNRRRNEFLEREQLYENQKDEFQQQRKALSQQARYTITLADGEEQSALLYRTSDTIDLALLKLNGYKTPYLEMAEPGSTKLGQPVYAIGSPLQLNNSVTSGVISNFRGEMIQTNAEIYPGNSGGPLITEDGRVVGVNSMKLITSKFEGLGFAIDINQVPAAFPEFFQK